MDALNLYAKLNTVNAIEMDKYAEKIVFVEGVKILLKTWGWEIKKDNPNYHYQAIL